MIRHTLVIAGALILTAAGCAAPPDRFVDVQKTVADRTGQDVHWVGHDIDQAHVDVAVNDLLAKPLSEDDAVRIALTNNHDLQSDFADLGIARADVVQAGLLHNPTLEFMPRFPDRPPSGVDIEVSVEQDLMSLLALPARKKIAAAEYEASVLKTADAVLELAARTRSAYCSAAAAQMVTELHRRGYDAAAAADQIAQKQHEAGNSGDLDLANQEVLTRQAKLDLLDSNAAEQDSREDLAMLMNLSADQATWSIKADLPEPPSVDPAPEQQSQAAQQRLDLAAARQAVVAAAKAKKLTRDLRFVSDASVGINSEKQTDGQTMIGPSFTIPIPLLDQGQAEVMRQDANFEQANQRYLALASRIGSEVRRAQARLAVARAKLDLIRTDLLPLQQRIVDESLRHYNGMLLGIYQLLTARQNQINTQIQEVEARKDYWLARVELARAVGAKL